MSKKVRSARGESVDFDLLRIKQQIAARPVTQDVRARQDFIEKKLHRRLKQRTFPKKTVDKVEVAVDPKLPGSKGPANPQTPQLPQEPTPQVKQKARPKK